MQCIPFHVWSLLSVRVAGDEEDDEEDVQLEGEVDIEVENVDPSAPAAAGGSFGLLNKQLLGQPDAMDTDMVAG